jgi:hypothetical protein
MPTSRTAIVDLGRSIAELAKHFEDGSTPPEGAQEALTLAAEKLAVAAREPDDNMYHLASQVPSFLTSQAV